jgi:hypothetical protein
LILALFCFQLAVVSARSIQSYDNQNEDNYQTSMEITDANTIDEAFKNFGLAEDLSEKEGDAGVEFKISTENFLEGNENFGETGCDGVKEDEAEESPANQTIL